MTCAACRRWLAASCTPDAWDELARHAAAGPPRRWRQRRSSSASRLPSSAPTPAAGTARRLDSPASPARPAGPATSDRSCWTCQRCGPDRSARASCTRRAGVCSRSKTAAGPTARGRGRPRSTPACTTGSRRCGSTSAPHPAGPSLAGSRRSAGVVVESSRPRALRRLGLVAEDWLAAAPGRVWVSVTGYGRDDPLQRAASATTRQ